MEQQQEHVISVEQRKKVSATAIDSVDAFSDRQMILSFAGGRIFITGERLKIVNFSKSSGAFSATGEISCVKYAAKGVGLGKKLFK